MFDYDLNDVPEYLGEGFKIKVTVKEVDTDVLLKSKTGGSWKAFKVTFVASDKRIVCNNYSYDKSSQNTVRNLFIACGLSKREGNKDVLVTNDVTQLIGKTLLVDTVINGEYTNIARVYPLSESTVQPKQVTQSQSTTAAAIKAQAPQTSNSGTSPLPAEIDAPVKEDIPF